MKWSNEQLQAIEIVNKNITISAGAGAGKTAVLIARLTKRIINDRISVENILAITFTEAAAGEIKKRLTGSLSDAYQQNPTDYLQKQLSLLATANISTIHAFCLYIIKNYYYVLGLDRDMTQDILDPAMAAYYKDQAIRQVFTAALDNPLNHLASLFNLTPNSDLEWTGLANTVFELATMALANEDYAAWLDKSILHYQSYQRLDQLPQSVLDIFWEIIARNFREYEQCLCSMRDSLTDDGLFEQIAQRLMHADKIRTDIEKRDYASYLSDYQENVQMYIKLKRTEPAAGSQSTAEKVFQAISGQLYTENIILHDLQTLQEAAEQLVSLTKAFINHYQQLKIVNRVMDFDDMERFALRILQCDNQAVANKLQDQFIDIMVDEFQDTNDLQDSIIRLVARPDNVFRVGDIKQSIYRFRKAKPEIMEKLINQPNSDQAVIFLRQNYRSKRLIIDFNNQLFNQLMNIEGYHNHFAANDAGSYGVDQQNRDNAPVEFHLLDLPKDDQELTANEQKARYIACQILTIRQQDPQTLWRDFCILVTTHAIKDIIHHQLDRYGIPSYGKGSAGLFRSRGVLAMISYLRLLADAKDKTALLSVLVSFYQFSDDQLAALTMHNSDLIEALTELYPDVMADIRRLQALSLEATIGQLFNEISQINDYYEKSNNEQQRANIDLLYDTILSFSLKSNSIQEFLRLVEQLSSNDLNEATAISENDDVVKIMTIHQSKGLQFKQVFFFSINRRSNPGHKSLAALNSSLGLALPVCDSPYRYSRKDIINTVINEKENTEETDEKIRVLYVALTRAQNRLYIVDQLPKETDTAISYQLLTANSYTSWMLAALPKIDPQLYLVKQINQYPAVSAAVRKISEAYQYPRYHGDKPLPLILTPSETETNDPYFDLDLQPQIKADVIGTQLHKLLEQLPDRRWQDEELLSLMTPELMPFMDGIKAFNQSELYQKFSRMTIMKEVPFAINDDRKIIHGYIDLLAEDEQEAIIVDFKTDRHTDPAALIGRYQTQLSLYARAVAMIYPHKKVTAYIYAVTLKSFVLIPNH